MFSTNKLDYSIIFSLSDYMKWWNQFYIEHQFYIENISFVKCSMINMIHIIILYKERDFILYVSFYLRLSGHLPMVHCHYRTKQFFHYDSIIFIQIFLLLFSGNGLPCRLESFNFSYIFQLILISSFPQCTHSLRVLIKKPCVLQLNHSCKNTKPS